MKIEKGIDSPKNVTKGRAFIYPFRQMEVGDSFFVPFEGIEKNRVRLRVNGSWQSTKNYHNLDWIITMRCEESGVRVWRIK